MLLSVTVEMLPTARPLACCAVLCCATWSAAGQFVSTLHETIEADSAEAITLDLVGDVEAANWPGNTVLVETDVRIFNTTEGAFEFFLEEDDRYGVTSDLTAGTLRIYSANPHRPVIRSRRGVAEERVRIRVHVPHRFAIDTTQGGGVYTRIYVERASEGLRTGELALRESGRDRPEPPPAELVTPPGVDTGALALEDDPDVELLDAGRLTDGVVISVDTTLVDFSGPGADSIRIDSGALRALPDR